MPAQPDVREYSVLFNHGARAAGRRGDMIHRTFIYLAAVAVACALAATGCRSDNSKETIMTDSTGATTITWAGLLDHARNGNPAPDKRVEKTEEEWAAILTPEQFRVTRRQGTERPFSSELCSRFEPGIYACVCCKTELFDGNTKFESGTGWPSFTQPLRENVVAYHEDTSHGMSRVEVTCGTCDAHLGHVFPDGPPPSGLRFCMNAVALEKVK